MSIEFQRWPTHPARPLSQAVLLVRPAVDSHPCRSASRTRHVRRSDLGRTLLSRYAELDMLSIHLAGCLVERGLGPGDGARERAVSSSLP